MKIFVVQPEAFATLSALSDPLVAVGKAEVIAKNTLDVAKGINTGLAIVKKDDLWQAVRKGLMDWTPTAKKYRMARVDHNVLMIAFQNLGVDASKFKPEDVFDGFKAWLAVTEEGIDEATRAERVSAFMKTAFANSAQTMIGSKAGLESATRFRMLFTKSDGTLNLAGDAARFREWTKAAVPVVKDGKTVQTPLASLMHKITADIEAKYDRLTPDIFTRARYQTDIENLTKAGKPLPQYLKRFEGDVITSWDLRLAKANQRMQVVYRPVNQFFGTIFMGWSPAFAVKNGLSNAVMIAADHGILTALSNPGRYEKMYKRIFGYIPYHANQGYSAASELAIEFGADVKKSWFDSPFRQLAAWFEEKQSLQVHGAAFAKQMRSNVKSMFGQMSPVLENAGFTRVEIGDLKRLTIDNDYSLKKALDVWLGANPLKRRSIAFLDEADQELLHAVPQIEDLYLRAIQTSKTREDFNALKTVIVDKLKTLKAAAKKEPTPIDPTSLAGQEIAKVRDIIETGVKEADNLEGGANASLDIVGLKMSADTNARDEVLAAWEELVRQADAKLQVLAKAKVQVKSVDGMVPVGLETQVANEVSAALVKLTEKVRLANRLNLEKRSAALEALRTWVRGAKESAENSWDVELIWHGTDGFFPRQKKLLVESRKQLMTEVDAAYDELIKHVLAETGSALDDANWLKAKASREFASVADNMDEIHYVLNHEVRSVRSPELTVLLGQHGIPTISSDARFYSWDHIAESINKWLPEKSPKLTSEDLINWKGASQEKKDLLDEAMKLRDDAKGIRSAVPVKPEAVGEVQIGKVVAGGDAIPDASDLVVNRKTMTKEEYNLGARHLETLKAQRNLMLSGTQGAPLRVHPLAMKAIERLEAYRVGGKQIFFFSVFPEGMYKSVIQRGSIGLSRGLVEIALSESALRSPYHAIHTLAHELGHYLSMVIQSGGDGSKVPWSIDNAIDTLSKAGDTRGAAQMKVWADLKPEIAKLFNPNVADNLPMAGKYFGEQSEPALEFFSDCFDWYFSAPGALTDDQYLLISKILGQTPELQTTMRALKLELMGIGGVSDEMLAFADRFGTPLGQSDIYRFDKLPISSQEKVKRFGSILGLSEENQDFKDVTRVIEEIRQRSGISRDVSTDVIALQPGSRVSQRVLINFNVTSQAVEEVMGGRSGGSSLFSYRNALDKSLETLSTTGDNSEEIQKVVDALAQRAVARFKGELPKGVTLRSVRGTVTSSGGQTVPSLTMIVESPSHLLDEVRYQVGLMMESGDDIGDEVDIIMDPIKFDPRLDPNKAGVSGDIFQSLEPGESVVPAIFVVRETGLTPEEMKALVGKLSDTAVIKDGQLIIYPKGIVRSAEDGEQWRNEVVAAIKQLQSNDPTLKFESGARRIARYSKGRGISTAEDARIGVADMLRDHTVRYGVPKTAQGVIYHDLDELEAILDSKRARDMAHLDPVREAVDRLFTTGSESRQLSVRSLKRLAEEHPRLYAQLQTETQHSLATRFRGQQVVRCWAKVPDADTDMDFAGTLVTFSKPLADAPGVKIVELQVPIEDFITSSYSDPLIRSNWGNSMKFAHDRDGIGVIDVAGVNLRHVSMAPGPDSKMSQLVGIVRPGSSDHLYDTMRMKGLLVQNPEFEKWVDDAAGYMGDWELIRDGVPPKIMMALKSYAAEYKQPLEQVVANLLQKEMLRKIDSSTTASASRLIEDWSANMIRSARFPVALESPSDLQQLGKFEPGYMHIYMDNGDVNELMTNGSLKPRAPLSGPEEFIGHKTREGLEEYVRFTGQKRLGGMVIRRRITPQLDKEFAYPYTVVNDSIASTTPITLHGWEFVDEHGEWWTIEEKLLYPTPWPSYDGIKGIAHDKVVGMIEEWRKGSHSNAPDALEMANAEARRKRITWLSGEDNSPILMEGGSGRPVWAADAPTQVTVGSETADGVTSFVDRIWNQAETKYFSGLPEPTPSMSPEKEKAVQEFLRTGKGMMNSALNHAVNVADKSRDFALVDYAGGKKNVDSVLGLAFPYQFWYSRNYANWVTRLGKNPWMATAYVKYKETLEDLHAGQPDWWKQNLNTNELFGLHSDNPMYFNLEATINPLYGLTGVDFDDYRRRQTGVTRFVDDLGKVGPSVWTPYVWLMAFGEAISGRPDSASAWAGRMIPQTQLIKAVTDKLGVDKALGLTGGVELDPFVMAQSGKWFQGQTIYERNRATRFLWDLVDKGVVSYAQAVDAARLRSGPHWDMAVEMSQNARSGGQITGGLLGVGFKGRSPQEMQIDQAYSQMFGLQAQKPEMSPEEYRKKWTDMLEQYPFLELTIMARKADKDRDEAFVWSVISRIPPGATNDYAEMVGLNPKLLNLFYESKGQMYGDSSLGLQAWAEPDRETFMGGITALGAVLAMPPATLKHEWNEGRLSYSNMTLAITAKMTNLSDPEQIRNAKLHIEDYVDAYFAMNATNPDQAKIWLKSHPEVQQYLSLKEEAIFNDPLLQKYYGGISFVESAYKRRMYAVLEQEFGEDISELQAAYFEIRDAGGDTRTFLANYPQLREYWRRLSAYKGQIGVALDAVANMLPKEPSGITRPDAVMDGIMTSMALDELAKSQEADAGRQAIVDQYTIFMQKDPDAPGIQEYIDVEAERTWPGVIAKDQQWKALTASNPMAGLAYYRQNPDLQQFNVWQKETKKNYNNIVSANTPKMTNPTAVARTMDWSEWKQVLDTAGLHVSRLVIDSFRGMPVSADLLKRLKQLWVASGQPFGSFTAWMAELKASWDQNPGY